MTGERFGSRLRKLTFQPLRTSVEGLNAALRRRDARTSERLLTFKVGFIRYAGCQAEVACLLRDMPRSGVRISLNGAIGLPEDVKLFIPQLALKLDAKVRWRRGGEAGLDFAKKAAPEAAKPNRPALSVQSSIKR